MVDWLWLSIPLAPLAGLLALWLWRERAVAFLALSCLPALIGTLWPVQPLALTWLWPGAQWGLDDALGRALLAFTAALWAAASVYAAGTKDPRALRFWVFWQLTLTGNLLLIIALDGASFYVGFTLMSLAAYGLVVHLLGPGPRRAARVYLQLAVLGEMLLYAGLMLRVHEAGGSLALSDWQTTPIGALTAGLLLVGFGLKAGFWPLHVWLPLAHPAAPAAASAVLSGAMIKAGLLGLWRFLPEVDPVLHSAAPWLVGAGLFGAFYAVGLGLLQQKAKTALAYSSVSQMGYLLLVLALTWHQPAAGGALLMLYMVHHGLAKGALFLGAGLAAGRQLAPWHWAVMALPALALAGLPLTSGAAVKTLLKDALGHSDFSGLLWLLGLGSATTALLVLRALWLMWRSTRRGQHPPPALTLPWLGLSLAPLLVPWAWAPMRHPLMETLSLYASWSLLWPLLAALGLAALALLRHWRVPAALTRLPQPAVTLSLKLKRWTQGPARRARPQLAPSRATIWRERERRWNRFWARGTVGVTAWLLVCLLLIGWMG